MVKLDVVCASNTALVARQPLVAVFTGVAGIAGFAAQSLAATHGESGKGLRAYIVGRSLEKVQKIIDDCTKVCPAGQFLFVKVNNLALLKDVDTLCAEIIQTEENEARSHGTVPKIDMLVMGQAIFEPFGVRRETPEGIDTFMSLVYYSRMRLTTQLLPLLLRSTLPARIISIFGPQRAEKLIENELSLRQNYGFMIAGSHIAYLTTFFMEHLAAQHPGKLALVHYYPGLVLTDAFVSADQPWWFRWIFTYGRPMIKVISVGREECGSRVVFAASERFEAKGGQSKVVASDGVVSGGAYRVNWDGEIIAPGKQFKRFREEGWFDKAVNHTLKAFEEIEAGRKFID